MERRHIATSGSAAMTALGVAVGLAGLNTNLNHPELVWVGATCLAIGVAGFLFLLITAPKAPTTSLGNVQASEKSIVVQGSGHTVNVNHGSVAPEATLSASKSRSYDTAPGIGDAPYQLVIRYLLEKSAWGVSKTAKDVDVLLIDNAYGDRTIKRAPTIGAWARQGAETAPLTSVNTTLWGGGPTITVSDRTTVQTGSRTLYDLHLLWSEVRRSWPERRI